MNPLIWLSRLLDTPCGGKIIPDDPLPPPPAPKPVVLSCFVQGVIKSLETEPDQWGQDFYIWYSGVAYAHKTLCVSINVKDFYNWRKDFLPGSIADYTLTADERAAVLAALTQHVIEPRERGAVERARCQEDKRQRDLAARKAAFEKLGCPASPGEASP